MHILNVLLIGPLPNTDGFILVADIALHNIYQVDVTTGATAQLLPFGTATAVYGLAYDSTAMAVYWTDSGYYSINRYSLLTDNNTLIHRERTSGGKYELFILKNGNHFI